jgi:hypothetical protein
MRQQHCASRNAMNSVHQALSGAPLSSDVPGLGSWDSVAGRWRSTEWYGTTAPERSLQAYARPVYLIEINILLFAFHVFAKLETAKASIFMNKFRELGLIDYNGSIEIHSSLLNVVLHDQPQIKR